MNPVRNKLEMRAKALYREREGVIRKTLFGFLRFSNQLFAVSVGHVTFVVTAAHPN